MTERRGDVAERQPRDVDAQRLVEQRCDLVQKRRINPAATVPTTATNSIGRRDGSRVSGREDGPDGTTGDSTAGPARGVRPPVTRPIHSPVRCRKTATHKNVVVIGAGPAGLTAAYQLGKQGVDALVLEADSVVGGISRTVERDGWRFDLGGHRFFTKVRAVEELWHEILPDGDSSCDRA